MTSSSDNPIGQGIERRVSEQEAELLARMESLPKTERKYPPRREEVTKILRQDAVHFANYMSQRGMQPDTRAISEVQKSHERKGGLLGLAGATKPVENPVYTNVWIVGSSYSRYGERIEPFRGTGHAGPGHYTDTELRENSSKFESPAKIGVDKDGTLLLLEYPEYHAGTVGQREMYPYELLTPTIVGEADDDVLTHAVILQVGTSAEDQPIVGKWRETLIRIGQELVHEDTVQYSSIHRTSVDLAHAWPPFDLNRH
jgi:hypothetical protein